MWEKKLKWRRGYRAYIYDHMLVRRLLVSELILKFKHIREQVFLLCLPIFNFASGASVFVLESKRFAQQLGNGKA